LDKKYSEWCGLYAEALWLEEWRLNNLAEMISTLFGGGDKSDT
jgi:hypothetical protein